MKIRTWSVAMITAPRPVPTLDATRKSLAAAGWPEHMVVDDRNTSGHWQTWQRALKATIDADRDADAYLIVEDDAVFWCSLRTYLERTLWPAPPGEIAVCSPYCPGVYRLPHAIGPTVPWSFNVQERGDHLVGTVAWVLPRFAAKQLAASIFDHLVLDWTWGTDRIVGRWAAERGLGTWYHNPSLVQHTGVDNSASDRVRAGVKMSGEMAQATDFVGEEF